MTLVQKRGAENALKARLLVDEIIFLEEKLVELKQYPFLSVNPSNHSQQKATPASRQYKEFLQQYNNSLKLLLHITGDMGANADDTAESPLREWVRSRKELFK